MYSSISPHDTIDDLTGVRKAAILLLSLDSDASGMMLKAMPTKAVEEVTRELASIGSVPKKLRDEVVTELLQPRGRPELGDRRRPGQRPDAAK